MTGATDISIGLLGCSRVEDQDLFLVHRSGPYIFLDSGGPLVIYISPFFITLTSPEPPLSPAHEPEPSSTSSSCILSAQWCLTTQNQGPWLDHRWCLVEHSIKLSLKEWYWALCFYSLPCPGLETSSSTWYLITLCQGTKKASGWLWPPTHTVQRIWIGARPVSFAHLNTIFLVFFFYLSGTGLFACYDHLHISWHVSQKSSGYNFMSFALGPQSYSVDLHDWFCTNTSFLLLWLCSI